MPPRQLFCQTDKTVCAIRRRCASHRIAGRSNHRFIAGSVLQKEMPSEWMASLFGAGYGNRTRLCGLGSDRSTDELTLHIKLLEQGTGILRRLRRLRVPAHFLLALPKAAMPCIAPSYDGKILVIEPAFRGLGSDRSTDELTLHIKLLEQGTGILRRLRRLRVPAHFLLALPKAAMPCIAPSYDGKMLVIEPAFRGLEDTAFCR